MRIVSFSTCWDDFISLFPFLLAQVLYLTSWLSNINWEGSQARRSRAEMALNPALNALWDLTGSEAAPRNPAEPKDYDDESPQFPALAALPPPG